MSKIDCSIIFPLLNEEENIVNSYSVLKEIMESEKLSYEIIYVNDGSTDNSEKLIKELCKKDKNVKLISFSRNFGQQSASLAGFKYAKGKCAINMDIDLEENPDVIPSMIQKWREGYEVVTVKRRKRREGVFKRITSGIYYKFLKMLGVKNIDNVSELRLLDRKAINELIKLDEHNTFLRNQLNWLGFKHITLEAERTKRQFGKTKFNFKKQMQMAVKGIVNSTDKPLYWSFGLSVGFFALCLISITLFVVLSVLNIAFDASFWLMPIILASTGTLLLVLGFIGMYLAFTYDEVRNRPRFIVGETVNIED